jgi:uncharacterized phage infection (PIP) family protein YhgE
MASAVIGALRVDLSLNSAQYVAGLNRAQTGLTRFGKMSGLTFAAAAGAAAAAAAAIVNAVGKAVDRADDIGKMAQRVGLGTEALSRLEYAAKLSDVSLDQLGTGLKQLSKNMAAAATGNGTAAAAFNALGVSVVDANGKLRPTEAVFLDLASAFKRLEDGAQKTALSMAAFGKSGSDLIPLLNEGAEGIRRYAAESDAMGRTVNSSTATAAQKVKDAGERIGGIFDGLALKIAEGFLPAMESIADLVSSPSFTNGVTLLSNLIGGIAQRLAAATGWAIALADVLPHAIAKGADQPQIEGFEDFIRQHRILPGADAIGAGAGTLSNLQSAMGLPAIPPPDPKAVSAWQAAFAKILAGARSVQTEFGNSGVAVKSFSEAMMDHIEQAAEAAERAAERMRSAWSQGLSHLGNVLDSVAGLMEKSGEQQFAVAKAFSIASSIAKGIEAVISSYAAGARIGGPFLGAAFAGAAALATGAQIAALNSVTSSSRSMPGSASGPSAPAPDAGGLGTSVNITMHGESFGRQAMQNLFDGLSDALADKGIKFVTSPIGG